MASPGRKKMSPVKIGLIATALMLPGIAFIGSILLFVSLRVVEPSDDGTFSVRVDEGSKWSIATRNGSSDVRMVPSADRIHAVVDGVAVEFREDTGVEVLVDTPLEQVSYQSVMTATMPADGMLTVGIADNSGQYVLMKNDAVLFFMLLVPGVFFLMLSFGFFAWAALRMLRQTLKQGFGLIR